MKEERNLPFLYPAVNGITKLGEVGSSPKQRLANLLPYDGVAKYYGILIDPFSADLYFASLLQSTAWKNDEAIFFGKHIITKRKVAWYGDSNYNYSYSNTDKKALPWTKELLELKQFVEEQTGHTFNSCLLNLYHNGEEGMAWHSDDEKALGEDPIIASLSFGAERKFCFKHKNTKEQVSLHLENGSLLLMKDFTQANWLHSLPKSKKVIRPRINLTFRTMLTSY
ncbi:alpha-ketoglutarate-dependent dioxygenase AlkB [Leptospira langatensis]|uniref:Alpha-ketoglutarate-dependent dioxygenase AlkB n=1 Tax=Leptospira langatensis TaxID=2484983 RepID=A0A5F1ZSC9_9LEPT|nr:alpha-ketoglutarate-dependent dioxygenase AlkB [Leptospira langatensis]TGJ98742.1 alpha-ketoglutarate-dependent dioxygenase AlkB [Leptospira langatensis]TGL40691.1 alpha-ketoglutarate-dependent dioxygenase AlkB [Leptospira langatensis]